MRLNFEVSSSVVDLIDRLQSMTGASKKGVVVGALLLLKWSIDQQKQGRKIVAVADDDGESVVSEYNSDLLLHASIS
jgi:hypothetical protein